MNCEIKSMLEKVEHRELTREQIFQEAKEKALHNQKLCNSFVTIMDDISEEIEGPLQNIPYVLKDNFSTKGILTTGSSRTLENYVPVYNSTVYEKLKNAGAILIGKTAMDEFGLGATGTTAHTGMQKNPWDVTRQAGGSSSGSAASVAAGVVPFGIGSDTGDSVRKPAAYCGIVGYKPTYGMISRYGLYPFASSMDHVGVLSRSVYDIAMVVDVLKGKDDKDMTTFDSSMIHLEDSLKKERNQAKLFYLKEIVDIDSYENPSDELRETLTQFEETIEMMRNAGMVVEEQSMDRALLEAIPATYTCITCAEATSNLSNLTGIIFGPQPKVANMFEMMKEHRSNGFSPLIKRRLVIGSYVLQKENQEKYFLNAQRVRHLVVEKMNDFFEQYDALILPCSSGGAKRLDGSDLVKGTEVLENHMVIGNFGGFPSITIPNGFVNGLPIGINFTAKVKDDENLLSIAYQVEGMMDYHGQIARGE